MEKKKRQKKFKTIATHVGAHLDEIVAICLLKRFGENKFPGISKAKVVYWNTGGKTPDGRTVAEWESDGVLIVGMCGSRFDEHPSVGKLRAQNECAATLVAKYLGVDDDPSLKKILQYVVNRDTQAEKNKENPFDFASVIKILHQKYPDAPNKVIRWAIEVITAKYEEQLHFFTATKKEFEEKAIIENVPGHDGRTIKIVSIPSDDVNMNKLARSKHGCQADIVIQRKSSGHTQLFTNKKSRLNIRDIVQIVRYTEQERKHKFITTNWKELGVEGNVPGAEEWFFHEEGQMLLNGSLTANGVPKTRIYLNQILDAVRIGINTNYFDPKFATECQKGNCASSKRRQCSLYNFGLHRCRKIRAIQYNQNNQSQNNKNKQTNTGVNNQPVKRNDRKIIMSNSVS